MLYLLSLFIYRYSNFPLYQFQALTYKKSQEMILDRNKNKLKIQINKALQTVNNIIKPTSEIKTLLQNQNKEISIEKMDKIHETILDKTKGEDFIACEFNKVVNTNNYRSPYSNRYYPSHHEDYFVPSPLLRDLEEKGNLLFSEYAKMYYGQDGCISNFYVYQTEEGLNFAYYVKKIYKDAEFYGVWCSTNVIQIRGDPSKSVSYKLQTSILYELNVLHETNKQLLEIHGSIKKHRVQSKRWSPEYEMDEFHLIMTGKLVEQVETSLRQQIQSVFVFKTKQIIFKTRFINSKDEQNQRKKRAKDISKAVPAKIQ